ncbi:MAG: hypothetical protein ACRDJX_11670 [Solirubrobacteraceae bacterium]
MSRLADAWRELAPAQRRAAIAALGLFVSMLLPWYDKTDTVVVHGAAKATQTSLSAFQAFSFVEAAVLLVSAGILATLFARAERRDFQLPGGDGLVVMIAGGWTALLIFYRLLDKPELQGNERVTSTVGVEWGIFIALLLALGLVLAGARMRAEERPEPPLRRARARPPRLGLTPHSQTEGGVPPIVEVEPVADLQATLVNPARRRPRRPTPVPARESRATGRRPRFPPAPPEQLSFEDPPGGQDPR